MILMETIKEEIEKFANTKIEDPFRDLLDMGYLDSLGAIDLLVSLERTFNVKFSFTEYTQPNFFNVNSITNTINRLYGPH